MSPVGAKQEVWYAGGLRFACAGCGRCCRGPGGYVWVNEDEVARFAKRLGMSVKAFGETYLRWTTPARLALIDNADGDCVFLGADGRCGMYDIRPSQCRTYPWWPEVIRSRGNWEAERRHCPGIGAGPVHDLETIRKGLAEAD